MAAKTKIISPMDVLIKGYQTNYVNDKSRWKYGLWSRQTGKDFVSEFEAVQSISASELKKEKQDWLVAAPSERQSLESLGKAKEHVRAFGLAVADYQENRAGGSETMLKSGMITFPGGSRIIAVPGQPDTVRGFSANVILTEFAFFEDPDATWRAILPSITNPLRGGLKKVRLITTPNGIGNKAHDLWMRNYCGVDGIGKLPDGKLAQWSCHFCPIQKAVADGLPVDIEEIRAAIDDPEGWAQEYECQFLDVQSTLLPYELIASCESLEATATVPVEFWLAAPPAPLVMGIDFGRRRDLTVAWTDKLLGDVAQAVEVLELEKMPTDVQVETLRPRLLRVQRACLDYTGPGVGLGDYLVKEFGEWNPEKHLYGKIELVTFTNANKVDLFSKLRMAFEKRARRIPISRVIREDLHSINRVASPTGVITYKAPHTADGHADRCTALALAERARTDLGGGGTFYLFENTKMSRILAGRRERTVFA